MERILERKRVLHKRNNFLFMRKIQGDAKTG